MADMTITLSPDEAKAILAEALVRRGYYVRVVTFDVGTRTTDERDTTGSPVLKGVKVSINHEIAEASR